MPTCRQTQAGAPTEQERAWKNIFLNELYKAENLGSLRLNRRTIMRISVSLLTLALALTFTGCSGPERKLGRGLNNLTEFTRAGEMRRSIEQTALWEGPEAAYTTGVIRGFNRSVVRTVVGVVEVATFPVPPYDPLLTPKEKLYPDYSVRNKNDFWGGIVLPADPVYPENFRPGVISDSLFATDTSLGFSGGDVAPMIPGSRFRVFEH